MDRERRAAVNTLGEQIRSERERRKWTQDALATQVGIGMNKQRLSAIERGRVMPTIDQQMKICKIFDAMDSEKLVWLLRWLSKEVEKSSLCDLKTVHLRVIEEAILQLNRIPIDQYPGTYCSLEDFPKAFQPITVICGDRREQRPGTRGDLLTYPIAITDIMFLERLGLDKNSTIIKSDKLTVLMDDDYLTRMLGETHLLIVGSPAVNHATRLINRSAVFRFDLDLDLTDWENKLRSTTQLNDSTALEVFYNLIQNPKDREAFRHKEVRSLTKEKLDSLIRLAEQLMGNDTAKSLITRFRNSGLVDPADGKVHGTYTKPLNDFGIVSLAPNPFAESGDYVCVLVAGIHGPGTAHAMRALAEKKDRHGEGFQDRPFGGVIEVTLDEFKDWPTRFEKAEWEWQTNPYTPEKILTNLENELQQKRAGQEETFTKKWSCKTIQECLDFIRNFIGGWVRR